MNLTPQAPLTHRLLLALTCALATAPAAWSQTTAEANAKAAADANNPAPVVSARKADDKLILSPFVVTTKKDAGYFAENTLAGSRLNTNLADLAASITVVTKQQLEDTGAVDINDVFLYEANTEGAGTFTPYYLNRGAMSDTIGGYSGDDGKTYGIATANRVRGLGSADTAQNNYPTIALIPFDSYNTNSIEISRGPNSMLFGTGRPSGIVNQSTAEAVLGQRHTTVNIRGGSFGAHRSSVATNIPLGDKVAIYLSGLYDSRGFERKPSSDVYRREYAAITYAPNKKTKFTASFEHYHNYNNRPNYNAPRDFVTPWLQYGKPGWDPTTQMVTFYGPGGKLPQGSSTAPYLLDTRDTRYVAGVTPIGDGTMTTVTLGVPGPFYIYGLQAPSIAQRSTLFIDDGNLLGFWVGTATFGGLPPALPAAAARTQAQWLAASRRYTNSNTWVTPVPAASTGATEYNSWNEISVTNKAIYDWEKWNMQGSNYGTQNARTYNIEYQQNEIIPGLNFQAGWFRQELSQAVHYGEGQANQSTRMYVDTNTKLLDGTPNPYFGSPYLNDWQTDTFVQPQTNDNLRAMLAYERDLTNNQGWTRFLGRHRLLALVSRQKTAEDNTRWRLGFDGGDPRFLPTAASLAAAGNGRTFYANQAALIQRIYYMGKNDQGVVQRGIRVFGEAGYGGINTASLNFYDWNQGVAGAFAKTDMRFEPLLNYLGGNGLTTKTIDSWSLAWQSYLWQERIIPTLGWRNDSLRIRSFFKGALPGGVALTNADMYANGFADPLIAKRLGLPYLPAGDTTTRGVVVRPFKGWASIDHGAENGSFVSGLLQNLSFHYNHSDNFNAPSGVTVDYSCPPPPAGARTTAWAPACSTTSWSSG